MIRTTSPVKAWLPSTRLLTGLLLVGVVGTAACSGAAASGTPSGTGTPTSAGPISSSAGAQPVTVTVGNSMSFDPATISVTAGRPVELMLRNNGQMPHDLTLSDGVAQPVKITANGGQTAGGSFTIDKPGNYTFECSMPGHAAAGMRGTITVQ